ncbi:hypothetical protein NLG97_g7959 [Lecanicillium saksenae]|uniref:Uncharacterized protein n=1 Tax=Lecanicillium saksenae TaxID=468837 RepID=A0ACC1QKD7_9HYPO|nr:hypothetical protein NLG97_g7959 [Lecanicillium saksenae]
MDTVDSQDDGAGVTLTGAQETLLITLLAKYNDFHQPRPLVGDRWAVDVIDCLGKRQHDNIVGRMPRGILSHPATVTMRVRTMDEWVTEFLQHHKDEPVTVVHLACGLDARALRLREKCGVDVRWIDLDMTDVIDARRRVAAAMPVPRGASGAEKAYSYSMVASDVTEKQWLEDIPADRKTLVIMEGLSMYLSEETCNALIERMIDHFAPHGGEMVFDVMGSKFALILNWIVRTIKHFDVHFGYTINSPKVVLQRHQRLGLLENYSVVNNPALKLLSWTPRMFLWFFSWMPYASTMGGFYRFKM